jgi:hypothetical protein
VAGVRLGAGLLIALAAGAAAGGWWLLGAVVLAGLLAVCVPEAQLPPRATPLAAGARLTAKLALVPVFASVFATYLLPEHRAVAAVAVVVVVTVASALGLSLPRFVRAWLLGILLVAAAGLVALCLAIAPERGAGSGPGGLGIFAAAALLFPLLRRPKAGPDWWLAGSVAVALAICTATLYQLGPVRLGLSEAPVGDLLAAVDGQALEPLLAGVVVLATLPAALGALAAVRAELPQWQGMVAASAAAAVGAALLDPVQALLFAAASALAEVLMVSLLALMVHRRDLRAVASAALAITLLAWLPPVYLLLALVVIAAAVAARRSGRTTAA